MAAAAVGYLQDEGAQDHAAEDGVPVDALEHVPLAVDLPGVDLVEELHHDEDVEDDGVVLRGRGVEGGVPPAVNVKHGLTCWGEGQRILIRCFTFPHS